MLFRRAGEDSVVFRLLLDIKKKAVHPIMERTARTNIELCKNLLFSDFYGFDSPAAISIFVIHIELAIGIDTLDRYCEPLI